MSNKHSMPEMKESGVNVTPLIDVIMCLIIFFMLVAKIGVSTGAVAMELPQTEIGKKISELGDSLILNVTDPNPPKEEGGQPVKDDRGHIKREHRFDMPTVSALINEADRTPAELKVKTESGQRQLYNTLKQAFEARKAKGKEKDFSITLRADKDLPFSMLQQVLVEIANAGIRNVNYGAKAKVGG